MSATQLSFYVLTFNNEDLLDQVLSPMREVADDILVVDSGSTDNTLDIAKRNGARILNRPLDDFRSQRQFALDNCLHNWVLSLDSDEVPDKDFVQVIGEMKARGFDDPTGTIAYRIKRKWIVMGKEIHAFFPIRAPDWPERLFRKDIVSFNTSKSTMAHEAPGGFSAWKKIERGSVTHYCCNSMEELNDKLNRYTDLAALDMKERGKKPRLLKMMFSPFAAWWKFYLGKGGYKDGKMGWILGKYTYNYVRLKYVKLKRLG